MLIVDGGKRFGAGKWWVFDDVLKILINVHACWTYTYMVTALPFSSTETSKRQKRLILLHLVSTSAY